MIRQTKFFRLTLNLFLDFKLVQNLLYEKVIPPRNYIKVIKTLSLPYILEL